MATKRRAFFDTIGYVSLPGFVREDIGWITDAFDAIWRDRPDVVHDGTTRTMFPNFANASPVLARLIEHPRIGSLCDELLGEGWAYYGGDGNFYAGDTPWHSDLVPCPDAIEAKTQVRHLKIAFYLDPLTPTTGALRVIPGSHLLDGAFASSLHTQVGDPAATLGVDPAAVPSVALRTEPGDVVAFDHRIKHASFGGSGWRRMFTMNLFKRCRTDSQRRLNGQIMEWYGQQGRTTFFGPAVLDGAPSERLAGIRHALDFERALQRGYASRPAEPAPA